MQASVRLPWTCRLRVMILLAELFAALVFCWVVPPVPVWAGYHNFADKRSLLYVPNCLDVLSNVPFLCVGIWGMFFLFGESARTKFENMQERIPYLLFFLGVALTGIGSGYYHLAPSNSRLVWDLLPMTISFVSIVDTVIVERISTRAGILLILPTVVFGIASVAYWYLGELHGHGDLRFYLLVQFFPALIIATIILLFPSRYNRTYDLFVVFVLYVLAKLFESLDAQIFSLGHIISGHTLKHLAAAVACYWILRMLALRTARTRNDITQDPRFIVLQQG